MAKEMDSCVKPAAGPLPTKQALAEGTPTTPDEGVSAMTVARVGQEAPDFEASAYVAGEGFKNIKLSSYRGQWAVICFYPGDFTFV